MEPDAEKFFEQVDPIKLDRKRREDDKRREAQDRKDDRFCRKFGLSLGNLLNNMFGIIRK